MSSFVNNSAFLFRILGDISHIYSKFILIQKIRTTKSCSGLSYKTQLIYMIVFLTRYLDLLEFSIPSILSFYNTVMKFIFLGYQGMLLFLIKNKYKYSYDKALDTFNVAYLLTPPLVLSFVFKPTTHSLFSYLLEYAWTFSVICESIAILPQLVMLQETGEAETLTSQYIFYLGMYRVMYTVNWLLKILGSGSVSHLLIATGLIQTALYVDFFVVYYRHVFSRGSTRIPKVRKG